MNAHLYQARKGGPPAGFAGGFWDAENNADHFGAREYEKTHGQWLTPDPAGLAAVDITNPQTWNRYAYVANDPLSYVDPLGLNRAFPGQCNDGNGVCPDEGGGADPASLDGTLDGGLLWPIFEATEDGNQQVGWILSGIGSGNLPSDPVDFGGSSGGESCAAPGAAAAATGLAVFSSFADPKSKPSGGQGSCQKPPVPTPPPPTLSTKDKICGAIAAGTLWATAAVTPLAAPGTSVPSIITGGSTITETGVVSLGATFAWPAAILGLGVAGIGALCFN